MDSPLTAPVAVLVPVPDPSEGLLWYQRAFPTAVVESLPDSDFKVLSINHFQIEVVPSDAKLPTGMAGTVLYWQFDDLLQAIKHFQSLGSTLYRGPLQIEQGMGMCQMTDTFGNLIGLRGLFNQNLDAGTQAI